MDESDSMFPAALLATDHQELDGLFLEGEDALHRGDVGGAHSALDRIWMRLAVHIRAEHKVLFPALAGSGAEWEGHLQTLRVDHDFFMAALAVSLQALRGPVADLPSIEVSMQSVRDRLTAHNALEESRVYPLADSLPSKQRQQMVGELAWELAFLPDRYRRG